MRLKEFIDPVACYYHGSVTPDLKVLKTRPSKLVKNEVVFAAILPEISIAMSGGWTDEDFDFGHNMDAKHKEIVFKPYVMKERKKGAFKKFFNQPLFIYEVPADYFEQNDALQDFEVVSYTDVPVHAMIKVIDAFEYLQGSPALRLVTL